MDVSAVTINDLLIVHLEEKPHPVGVKDEQRPQKDHADGYVRLQVGPAIFHSIVELSDLSKQEKW